MQRRRSSVVPCKGNEGEGSKSGKGRGLVIIYEMIRYEEEKEEKKKRIKCRGSNKAKTTRKEE